VGKPNESDLKKAAKFVRNCLPKYFLPDFYSQVVAKLPVNEGSVNTYTLNGNGKQVVLKGDFVTINQSACLGCGKCAKVCPLGIIELVDHKAVPQAELDCTLCRLCEAACTERAISLHYTWMDAIKVAIRHGKRNSL
jgi:ferredoxin